METRQVLMETMSNTSCINSCFQINTYAFVLSSALKDRNLHSSMQLADSALRHSEATCMFHVFVEKTDNLLVVPLPELHRPWIRGDKNSAPEERAEWCVEERRD